MILHLTDLAFVIEEQGRLLSVATVMANPKETYGYIHEPSILSLYTVSTHRR